MNDPGSLPFDDRSRRLIDDAVVLADAWRVAGRWLDALLLLTGVEPLVRDLSVEQQAIHALTTAHILTDQAGFGGLDTLTKRSTYLDSALMLAQQTDSSALLGAVWNARGMSLHHAFLDSGRTAEPPDELPSFERGLHAYQQTNNQRGIAESFFHIGLVYGVVRQDHTQALPFFQQSYTLAQTIQDSIIASYAIRHIGFAQHNAGNLDAARASLQESLELREQAGFIPGTAMALVMLAYADAELGQRALALGHLQRAKAIFQHLDAENKVVWVDQLLREFQQEQT
jgi:tetratricopeptide (TPR) repeat protein